MLQEKLQKDKARMSHTKEDISAPSPGKVERSSKQTTPEVGRAGMYITLVFKEEVFSRNCFGQPSPDFYC